MLRSKTRPKIGCILYLISSVAINLIIFIFRISAHEIHDQNMADGQGVQQHNGK